MLKRKLLSASFNIIKRSLSTTSGDAPKCCCPCTLYDCRKYGHRLPENNIVPNFEIVCNFPSGIFRCTYGEILGPCADKCQMYRNPEYFSFHHMTYYDMHLFLRMSRVNRPNPKRKTIICL